MATYSLSNFLGTPVEGDTTLKIYDKTRKLRYEINPNIAYFFTKSNIVIIRIEDRNDIYLDFENQAEAAQAIAMLNTAKQELLNPVNPCDVGTLTKEEQLKIAYYHSLSKLMTMDEQNISEPHYKSAHNVPLNEVWGTELPFCPTFTVASGQSLTNSAITMHFQVPLTKVPDSNGQSWYFNNGVKFVRPWIGPQDVPHINTNLPSDGFTLLLYRGDDATKGTPGTLIQPLVGDWVADYYAGIIHFGLDHTPSDLGWGTVKATFFEYTGVFGVPGITDAFTTVEWNSGTSELVFNSGLTSETSVVITGTGGGTLLTIEDEGTLVSTGVTTINFIGADVRAQSGGGSIVNVYIPAPAYVSHFNATDGTTTTTVSPISTTNRWVALPNIEGSPYKVGNWTTGGIHSTIRNSVSPITYTSTNNFSILNTSTTFSVTVYDANGTTPLATHSITLNGNSVQTLNNITITVTDWSTDADRYKATVSISVSISSILPQGGRFSILLRHTNGSDGTYSFTQNDIFRDTESLSVGITGSLTILPQSPTIKQISGVYYYTTGSQWHVNLPLINNLNSRSYPTTQQLRIDDTNLFINTTINAHGESGSFSGGTWTKYHDTTGAIYDKLDWITDLTNNTNWNHTSGVADVNYATATAYDWTLSTTLLSANYNYLIDTYVDGSDRNSEMFRSEDLRLQNDLVTPWDNTVNLSGGTGLQVLGDRLVYPQYNFTPYLPSGNTSQPNYTTLSGDKDYFRTFQTNGFDVSNGIIVFSDYNITEADLLSQDVLFDLSVDSGASWYSLNLPYTNPTMTDGSGCRTYSGEYGLGVGTTNPNALSFSLGYGYSTYIIFRITFTASATSKYIGGIDITDGNWI